MMLEMSLTEPDELVDEQDYKHSCRADKKSMLRGKGAHVPCRVTPEQGSSNKVLTLRCWRITSLPYNFGC